MIVEILGYLILAKILYEIGWFFFVYFIRAPASFKKFEGEWAVITGASWGIGYGFAVELAKRGVCFYFFFIYLFLFHLFLFLLSLFISSFFIYI